MNKINFYNTRMCNVDTRTYHNPEYHARQHTVYEPTEFPVPQLLVRRLVSLNSKSTNPWITPRTAAQRPIPNADLLPQPPKTLHLAGKIDYTPQLMTHTYFYHLIFVTTTLDTSHVGAVKLFRDLSVILLGAQVRGCKGMHISVKYLLKNNILF
jgi:hypothetical protein